MLGNKAKSILSAIAMIAGGFLMGAVEENLRYSVIHHEAKKGDKEAQAIVDQFNEVGQAIEDKLQ